MSRHLFTRCAGVPWPAKRRGAHADVSPPEIDSARRSLRETLVEAAAALIAKKGRRASACARSRDGPTCPEAAPYWHFTDREALLAAVAERGFVEMAQGMMMIRAAVADPRERLRALGIGYVQLRPSRIPRICA